MPGIQRETRSAAQGGVSSGQSASRRCSGAWYSRCIMEGLPPRGILCRRIVSFAARVAVSLDGRRRIIENSAAPIRDAEELRSSVTSSGSPARLRSSGATRAGESGRARSRGARASSPRSRSGKGRCFGCLQMVSRKMPAVSSYGASLASERRSSAP